MRRKLPAKIWERSRGTIAYPKCILVITTDRLGCKKKKWWERYICFFIHRNHIPRNTTSKINRHCGTLTNWTKSLQNSDLVRAFFNNRLVHNSTNTWSDSGSCTSTANGNFVWENICFHFFVSQASKRFEILNPWILTQPSTGKWHLRIVFCSIWLRLFN